MSKGFFACCQQSAAIIIRTRGKRGCLSRQHSHLRWKTKLNTRAMVESDSCTRLSSDSEGDVEGGSASSINADEILSASKMSGAASVDGVSILLTQQPSSEYNGGQNEIDASRTQVLQTSSIEAIPDGTAPVPFPNLKQQYDCDKPAADRKSDANKIVQSRPYPMGPALCLSQI
jgi:hypothetical protein